MPNFNYQSWFNAYGYDNQYDDLGTEISSYLGEEFHLSGDDGNPTFPVSEVENVGDYLEASGPVFNNMVLWAGENSSATGEEFATELFMQMFLNSDQAAQESFMNYWNNANWGEDNIPNFNLQYNEDNTWDTGAFDVNDDDMYDNLLNIAQHWGDAYGSESFGDWSNNLGDTLYSQGLTDSSEADLVDDFGATILNINQAIEDFHAEYGDNAYAEMMTQAAAESEVMYAQADEMEVELESQLQGLAHEYESLGESFRRQGTKEKSEEAARGYTKKSGFYGDRTADLQTLYNQMEGVQVQEDLAVDVYDTSIDLMEEQFNDYLATLNAQYGADWEANFNELINSIDNYVDDYNSSVYGESQEEQSWWSDVIGDIASMGGSAPPLEGTWEEEGFGACLLADGTPGFPCPNGTCVSSAAQCEGQWSWQQEDVDPGASDPQDPGWVNDAAQAIVDHTTDCTTLDIQSCVGQGGVLNLETCDCQMPFGNEEGPPPEEDTDDSDPAWSDVSCPYGYVVQPMTGECIWDGITDISGDIDWSDVRLKENIELVGKSPSGINIYEFDYKNKSYGEGRYRGAMAQEVTKASIKGKNGYLAVDYSKLDINFRRVDNG